MACLSEIGPLPIHPVTGDSVHVQALNPDGSIIYGNDGTSISAWTFPGLAYIEDVHATADSLTVAPDGTLYFGRLNGTAWEMYQGAGPVMTTITSPGGVFSGGGMAYSDDRVWVILNYDAGVANVGLLYEVDAVIGDASISVADSAPIDSTPCFTLRPNPATDGALWWSSVQEIRLWRADVLASSVASSASDSSNTYMMPVGDHTHGVDPVTGAIIGFSGGAALWREFAPGIVHLGAPECNPADLGFAGVPIGSFNTPSLHIAGMTDSNGIIWVSYLQRPRRWHAGVAGWA